jgi:2-C-methyl-D-erythritol 4-phosphate cytidylyltransferase
MKVSVIVAAAGRGTRFGGRRNKIFERLGGQPVFIRSLELFVNRDDVCQTILVINPDDRELIKERYAANIGFMGVKLVDGGPTRPDSVRNALAQVDQAADLVAIHDAVRPCVSALWIDAVFAEAAKTGAAILAYPIHGTMKKVSDAMVVDETVPRAGLWQAQTPQVFKRSIILAAYAKATADPRTVTDDAQLVEAIGQPVSVVMGDPRNVKITTPGDLALVEAVIDSLPKPKPKPTRGPFEEAQW